MPLTTSTEIKALKPKADRYDASVESEGDDGKNIPGLQIRVYPSGVKSWRYRYPLPGSPLTLGNFPEVSLKVARERHQAAYKLVANGIDPKEHQAAAKEQAAKEKAKKEAEITVAVLVDEFAADYLREHRDDPAQAERLLKVEVLPKWGELKANSLRRRDAVVLVRNIKRRAPVLANRVAALVVQLFGFAADVGHLEVNPMAGLKRPTKEVPRERKLDVNEIRTLWHALDERSSTQAGGVLKHGREDRRGTADEPRLTRAIALGLKLLLVTGQRRGELLNAEWSMFDDDARTWTIPAELSKNGKAHRVPLSSLALQLLAELKGLAGESRYLFPTPHIKLKGDACVTDKALTRAASRNQSGLAHWTPHDLRRTAASHMNRLGVDAIVVEKILNHTLPRMMETYNRHEYEDEMREALERWATELRAIVAGKSNVVEMPSRIAGLSA